MSKEKANRVWKIIQEAGDCGSVAHALDCSIYKELWGKLLVK